MAEVAFAGTSIKIDDVVVAIITDWQSTSNIEEQEVTGAEDTMGTSPNFISRRRYIPVGVDRTAQFSFIVVAGDAGQEAIKEAANAGTRDVELEYVNQAGEGEVLTGFFTNYQNSGQVNGMWTGQATFRANEWEDSTQA